MKKTILKILLILMLSFNIIGVLNADTDASEKGLTVTVTEKIPGANCVCVDPEGDENCPKSVYTCDVKKGFGGVMDMMGTLIKYLTFIAALGGVLFIVYNGIMYSMSGIDQGLKDGSKKKIIQTLVGLVILFLSGIILNLVAPWVYKL